MNIWVPTALGSLFPPVYGHVFLSVPPSLPVWSCMSWYLVLANFMCVQNTIVFLWNEWGRYSGTCVAFAWDTWPGVECVFDHSPGPIVNISTSIFENQTLGMGSLKPVGSYPDLYPSEKQCMVLMQVVLPRSPLVLKPLTGPWAGRKHRDEKHCKELKLLIEIFI